MIELIRLATTTGGLKRQSKNETTYTISIAAIEKKHRSKQMRIEVGRIGSVEDQKLHLDVRLG